jgi:hypothetical protein
MASASTNDEEGGVTSLKAFCRSLGFSANQLQTAEACLCTHCCESVQGLNGLYNRGLFTEVFPQAGIRIRFQEEFENEFAARGGAQCAVEARWFE